MAELYLCPINCYAETVAQSSTWIIFKQRVASAWYRMRNERVHCIFVLCYGCSCCRANDCVQQYIGPAISGVAQRLLGDQADRFFGLYQLKPLHTQFKPNPTQHKQSLYI